ncbi:hypothetical protein ACWGR4_40880 [Embleya sp. NPDC055664]
MEPLPGPYRVDPGELYSWFASNATDLDLPGGPRRLWDEVETAWHWWDGQQRPTVHGFGLTATIADTAAAEQPAWYSDRDHPLAAPRTVIERQRV